jgi:hypothetical protein
MYGLLAPACKMEEEDEEEEEEDEWLPVASMIRDLLPEHTVSHPVRSQNLCWPVVDAQLLYLSYRVRTFRQTPEQFHAIIFWKAMSDTTKMQSTAPATVSL